MKWGIFLNEIISGLENLLSKKDQISVYIYLIIAILGTIISSYIIMFINFISKKVFAFLKSKYSKLKLHYDYIKKIKSGKYNQEYLMKIEIKKYSNENIMKCELEYYKKFEDYKVKDYGKIENDKTIKNMLKDIDFEKYLNKKNSL